MKSRLVLHLATAAGLLALAACSDSTSPSASLIDQTTLTTDMASSAGDAVAADVQGMGLAETAGGLATPVAMAPASVTGDSLTWSFTKTCFDSTGTSTACGTAAVRKVATHWTFAGFRDDTAENGAVFTGDVTRSAYDTLTRNFTGSTEVSRTHDGNSAGSDTSSFVGPNVTRTYAEAGTDSIDAVVFNLPRSQFRDPVSGTVVRNVSIHATFKSATRSDTTDVTKRVEVDFNGTIVATLKIDGKTCDLNLLTHRVSNCQ